MKRYTFFWSPEGRPVFSTMATTPTAAWAQFLKALPQYKRYKGEVYVEVNDVSSVVA